MSDRIDISTVNRTITAWNDTKSNKNLTSDIINEVAEAIGFDTTYLCEGRSKKRCYSFLEEDIGVIRHIVEVAKSKEGKNIRKYEYLRENISAIESFMNDFLTLGQHNGMSETETAVSKVMMHKRTEYVVLKENIAEVFDNIRPIISKYMFAPNDFLCDEDDRLTPYDVQAFHDTVVANPNMSDTFVKALYLALVQERQSLDMQKSVNWLKSVKCDEIPVLRAGIAARLETDKAFDSNTEYADAARKAAEILLGKGKLKDKRDMKVALAKMAGIQVGEYKKKSDIVAMNEIGASTTEFSVEEMYKIETEESERLVESAIKTAGYSYWLRTREARTSDNVTLFEESFYNRYKEYPEW